MSIGKRLKELRLKKGLSQEELAGMMDVSRQVISKWELDNSIPDSSNMKLFTDIFGVSTNYILFGENGDKENNYYIGPSKFNIIYKIMVGFGFLLSLNVYIFIMPLLLQAGRLQDLIFFIPRKSYPLLIIGPLISLVGIILLWRENDLNRNHLKVLGCWTSIPFIFNFISLIIYNMNAEEILISKIGNVAKLENHVTLKFIAAMHNKTFRSLNINRTIVSFLVGFITCGIISFIIYRKSNNLEEEI